MTGIEQMKLAAEKSVEGFYQDNRVILAIAGAVWTRDDYAKLLLNLYHQVYIGTLPFAQAAAACPNKWSSLREFYLHHAAEEIHHYEWIQDDLNSIGYKGPDPRQVLPSEAAMSFISFNSYNAGYLPPARLASSAVLETLALRVNTQEQLQHLKSLGLGPANFKFFLEHTVADEAHEREVWDLIGSLDLTPSEWTWMAYSASLAGCYYKAMYDSTIEHGRLKGDSERFLNKEVMPPFAA
jgi:uncharacterized protein Smg (DUF494 family)